MIERFRSWKARGDLRVKYKDGNGQTQVWQINQDFLLTKILQIVKAYQAQGIKLTNRQLYYQLVASDIIPNAVEVYKRICTFLTDARYAGLIDWESIEDRGRVPEKHSEWDSVKDLIRSAVASYRLPRWNDQEYYVELYCEKQAMESVLKPIADKYHIFFGYNKGYSSASTMYDLSKRVKEQIQDGKKVIVLYLGDHDSSGLDMIRDIRERLVEFLIKGDDPVDVDDDGNVALDVVPLALNMTQIKKYNPPPNPAKISDPRAKWYISKYGQMSWELDALKPEVLRDIAEAGILEYIDVDKYNAWIKLESEQKKALESFGKKLDKDGKKGDDS
jgi:hypothetical protein